MSQYKLSVIVPSWNNPDQLTQMVNSMTRIGFFDAGDRELIIVNNGKQPCSKDYAHIIAKGTLKVVDCEDNRGWEGGLVEGLKVATGEFICFQNDDVHIPQNDPLFYNKLVGEFDDEDGTPTNVGIIAPITTCAAGIQSIYHQASPVQMTEVRYVIFLCAMMRRADLDACGGVDETLPGGDDIDLSIRMRQLGKKIYVQPASFLVHHGFSTGTRVKGGPEIAGGWNSREMSERTNQALIRKHGFKTYIEAIGYQVV